MSGRFQALVVLGTWLLMRPTLGSAAQGVHVDAVSSQVYLDYVKPDQTSVSLRGQGKAVDSRGLAMRSLAVGAGVTALLEAPMIWEKLSSMLGWSTSSPLELSNLFEGDATSDDGHYPEEPESWKIRGCFAIICLCTFVLGIMRRSFQRSAKPTTPSRTSDIRVQTPRVERSAKRQKSVTVVSPMVTPRGKTRAPLGHEGADDQNYYGCSDEDSNDPADIQFHKIYTPATSRACSKEPAAAAAAAAAEDEFETQFHKIYTPGPSRVSSKASARAASQSSGYGWEEE